MERPFFVGSNVNDCEFGIRYDPSINSAPFDFSAEQQDTNPFLTINQPSNQPNLYLYNTYSSTPSGLSRERTTEQQNQYFIVVLLKLVLTLITVHMLLGCQHRSNYKHSADDIVMITNQDFL
ncbi:hypothetical protein F8M41_011016 [Gigaspora margarita]|uniref:Uncharacterized protein n=1 Tax=Gigaspora margarita TaxID=4874 RepID=A0A8H3WZY4_GIGMA|nr:hypothetical protein F8M41_011016 [Gigaspora margarita]